MNILMYNTWCFCVITTTHLENICKPEKKNYLFKFREKNPFVSDFHSSRYFNGIKHSLIFFFYYMFSIEKCSSKICMVFFPQKYRAISWAKFLSCYKIVGEIKDLRWLISDVTDMVKTSYLWEIFWDTFVASAERNKIIL